MPTNVEDQLKGDIKAAMKAGHKDELQVLRSMMADAKNAAISAGLDRSGISDEVMLKVLRTAIKTRTESAALYSENGRTELADIENFQIGIIKRYLPPELSASEIEAMVDAVVTETGASGKAAMGAVIKETLARLGGRADGRTVQQLAAKRLG